MAIEVRERPLAPYEQVTINSIRREGKHVIVEFNQSVTHLQLTPEQAVQIADKLTLEAVKVTL